MKQSIASRGLYIVSRLGIVLSMAMMFFPGINPANINALINRNISLFTSGVAYNTLISGSERAIDRGWVSGSSYMMLFFASMVVCIGIGLTGVYGCLSVGNMKCKKRGNIFGVIGGITQLLGLGGIYLSYLMMSNPQNDVQRLSPAIPDGLYFFVIIAVLIFLSSMIQIFMLKDVPVEEKYEIELKYRIFMMFLPFAALLFVFSYLPLWGWRAAFYDYQSGIPMSADNFVGLKWFRFLFNDPGTQRDIVRVMRNTLAMSALGISTSWVAMAFAIFLVEMRNIKFRRIVQTFTTIPNFISWVMVYAIAFAIFSTDGFINSFMSAMGWLSGPGTNYLMGDGNIWLKMLAWGMWKGLGWSAIIYIASISGIDPQLYEAATVDGAGRFQKMIHVTLPGLMSTFFVLLLLGIAGILNNGLEQYMVFENPSNTNPITVLDLYVYQRGIENGLIPISTLIGMLKSLISVTLLFVANQASRWLRGGESII
ncbi:MAG: ABC transporter permease subunit [Lachnospiraceae bacterium]|jgi:putative aldouronate transport system permease protein|nr:ABC transporter permease subunit [Lachnospiraceae bacterium]